MKTRLVFFALVFLGLLSACAAPQPPENTATPTLEPSSTPTISVTPTEIVFPTSRKTITLEASPTKNTPTPTASFTPKPTPTSPYPVGPETPLPDPGFPEITTQNVAQLRPVFKIAGQSVWQNAISRDGKQLFVATNNGIFVYNKQGQQLAHWPSLILPNLPCESCLSINTDGTRFALATHKDGKWFAQIYNVFENNANLLLEKPIESSVQGVANEVRVALSPDGLLLAYGAADTDTLLINIGSSETLLTNQGGADSASFSPDGLYFVIRRRRQLLVWKTSALKTPANLQLPADDSPYAFSPDGKRLAIAATEKILAYTLDKLTISREISIPTTKDLHRAWQIAFLDEKTLVGYNARWDGTHTKATIDIGQWNLDTGATLQMATSETDSPDALSALWGVTISLTMPPTGPVALGQYSNFRFVDQDQLLVNSLNNACWLKLSSGETNCFNNTKYKVLSSKTEAYIEITQERATLLQDWKRNLIHTVTSPYPILGINNSADYFLINVKDATTDIYLKGRKSPLGSFPGTLLAYAESEGRIVVSTRQGANTFITMIDKTSLLTPYQKKDVFILKPLAIHNDNKVYFVQQDVGQPQVIMKVIDPESFAITNLARLSLPAEPQVMSISLSGTFAFGLKDGSVSIVSHDGLQVASFQAVYTPISNISLSPDGRYLAVASDDGIRVFAVLP